MIRYTREDYDWVLKIIKKHRRGISPKEIVEKAQELSEILGHRPRDEKPPGRDKICEIIRRGTGTDWDYHEGGGRSKTSLIKIRQADPLEDLGSALRHMLIFEKIKKLGRINEKRKKKLPLKDILELERIKYLVMTYPMYAYYIDGRPGFDRDLVFQRAVEESKKQLGIIRTIEQTQKKINNKFDKTRQNIEKLFHSDWIFAEVLKNRRDYKEYLKSRNTLRSIYGI